MTLTEKTTDKVTHTLGPWKVAARRSIIYDSDGADIASVAARQYDGVQQANAEFIVCACNSHADLLAALQHVNRIWGHKFNGETADMVDTAIAKAKGEA